MMTLLLIGVVMLSCIPFAVPLFEATFGILLTAPLIWFLIGKCVGSYGVNLTTGTMGVITILGVYVVSMGALYRLFGFRRSARGSEEYGAFVVFAGLFLLALHYALSWPNFIAMGERLRDYAILASTMHSPIQPVEPWMDGATLNYYVYWYRFGHFLSFVLGYAVWDTYHLMTAFALAFYAAAVFEVARKVCGLSIFIASITAVITALGSNVAGYTLAAAKDSNWWGPSRVVKGAINEFPAWSFVLGDLHPHFMNLGLLPFLLLIIFGAVQARESRPLAYVATGFIAIAGVFWMFAANAWEVPLWGGTLACVGASAILIHSGSLKRILKKTIATRGVVECLVIVGVVGVSSAIAALVFFARKEIPPIGLILGLLVSVGNFIAFFPCKKALGETLAAYYSFKDSKFVILLLYSVVIVIALKLSSSHIVAEGGALKRVLDPIPLTRTVELFRHWGFPLGFIVIGSVLLLPRASEKMLAGVLIAASLLIDTAAPFLFVLVGLQLVRLLHGVRKPAERSYQAVFSDGLLLASLCFLILPEAFFLDDPYGGENERMNTIFKVYTTAWGMLAISASCIFARGVLATAALPTFSPRVGAIMRGTAGGIGILMLVVTTRFFFFVVPLRLPPATVPVIEPVSEGLSEVEQRFPGALAVIRKLRDEPGTVIEAQGNAYDYTTFVSTLAGRQSYLGWPNHITLLTKKFYSPSNEASVYGEVSRREKVTEAIYSAIPCAEKLRLTKEEKISFVVLGVREYEKYSAARAADFSCFEEVVREQEYRLLKSSR